MSFQNNIALAGRISQDIRLNVNGDSAILNGTIAVQKSYKNKETGEYDADFFDFVIFSKVRDGKSYAQTMAGFLKKGMYIGITGELSNRKATKTKDGQDFYNDSNVVVTDLQLLESKEAVELREAKKDQTPAQETPTPVQEAPAEAQAPVQEAPVQEAPVEAPVEAPAEAPVEDAANFQDLAEHDPFRSSHPLEINDDDLPF